MKRAELIPILTLFFLLLSGFTTAAVALQAVPAEWELHEIEGDRDGFLRRTAGDPYIVFPEIEQQVCSLSGFQLKLRLDPMPDKPFYMELFWRATSEGFGEDRKVFFIVHPDREGDSVDFTVPLEQQGGFKQIRLDLPGDLDSAFKIEQYGIVPLDDLPEGTHLIDSYFWLSASAVKNPAVIVPYIIKTARHGMVRMGHDPVFLIFWLLMIFALLATHRFLVRSSPKQGPCKKPTGA